MTRSLQDQSSAGAVRGGDKTWLVQQCSSPLCILGGPGELHPTAPALQHRTGVGGTPACAKPRTLLASSLCVLLKGRTTWPWFIKVKYKLSLIVLISMTQA